MSASGGDLGPPSKTVALGQQAVGVIVFLVLFAAGYTAAFERAPPFIAEGIAGVVSIVGVVAARSVLVDGPLRRQSLTTIQRYQPDELPPAPPPAR